VSIPSQILPDLISDCLGALLSWYDIRIFLVLDEQIFIVPESEARTIKGITLHFDQPGLIFIELQFRSF